MAESQATLGARRMQSPASRTPAIATRNGIGDGATRGNPGANRLQIVTSMAMGTLGAGDDAWPAAGVGRQRRQHLEPARLAVEPEIADHDVGRGSLDELEAGRDRGRRP